ncbi:reverse transcriptase domain-containing protein [Tanacetum coccineum]
MNVPITFPPVLARDLSDEALVMEAEIEGYMVRRIHIDEGASIEIMYEHCFNMLHLKIKARLTETQTTVSGFSGERVKPLGKIELDVCFGGAGRCRRAMMRFTVIPAPSPYNIILGRPALKQLRAIPSTIHGMMKFPTRWGIATVLSQTPTILECRREEKKQAREKEKDPMEEVKSKGNPSPTEPVLVNPAYPEQLVKIGTNLSPEGSTQLKNLLKKQRYICMGTNRHDRGIVRRVKYPTWIANPVLVRKPDGSWRMCIDFKNLNSSCPKDYYPLPEIDSKIEAVMGYPLKCFLDAYKGYHQVQMSEEDEEKTAFYTDQGTFCYKKMPFGLKNAGATYQRLVDEAFDKQIGRNLEVYVDDMVIKSKAEKDMLADVTEAFDNLRRINMKLNLKKCSFGVEEGKFLGYMGEMQSLAGRLAALNRFLARSAERSLPFFETLKNITKENKEDYRWTEEAEKAFQELKKTILSLPTLATPIPEENLYIYLAASDKAISAVLMTERNGKQHPIRYVSKVLHDAEKNYAPLEKLALALRNASRRLRRYFEAHPITVITDQPIKQILGKAEASGRLAQYAVELGAYKITYEPRNSIKGQVLADFLNETPAEYEALLAGLRIAKKMGVQAISVKVDSKLVASQINGEYVACKENMIRYLTKAKEYIKCFKSFRIKNIPRNQNQKADVLSKLASVAFNNLTKEILVETLDTPSMDCGEINAIVEEEEENWMSPIIRCLEEGPLQANYVIREIHMGACSMHMKPRSVVAQAIWQGYYWPTMHKDAREEIRKCNSCQIHAPVPKMPKTLMTSIMASWPFFQWGMDVLGPLSEAPGKVNM